MAHSSLPAGRQVARSRKMYYLYILKNNIGKHYIGISSDPNKRLNEHNFGKVRSTKPYRPWNIVHIEKYRDRVEARQREVILKNNFTLRNNIFSKLI